MAGIGINLNRIFEKNTVTANLVGYSYSTVATIAPMILVIGNTLLMNAVFDVSSLNYSARALYTCTVLYLFIFSLLTASPFNAVLSKYLSDVIYEERYEDILPCFNMGLFFNILLSCVLGVPFCLWEFFVGKVALWYVFTGFCGYVSLVLVFYSMLYLSICKDYSKISLFFLIGMGLAFGLAALLIYVFHWEITYSMLLGLSVGFLLIACLETALVKSYFRVGSKNYRGVLQYFKKYWQLVFINFLYVLGLYLHNFVFWTTDLHTVVAHTFVCAEPYDLASCLAMFTNLSASTIFIALVEMHFHEKYKAYSEAVIGGSLEQIEKTKKRMFSQLAAELTNIIRIQFVISAVLYFLVMILAPRYGFSGLGMRIYPCLAAGYFILFMLYAEVIFLYYFSDKTGLMLTSSIFCLATLAGSIAATHFTPEWYGMGLCVGAFAGWCMAYARLRWVEKNIDTHIFCQGNLLKRGGGAKPSEIVYNVYQKTQK